jgi:hypothetical protein
MKPYPVDAPVFCKNCKRMRLAEFDSKRIATNMRCILGVKWIVDSYVDGAGHWNTQGGFTSTLPLCYIRNRDGKCQSYIPKR